MGKARKTKPTDTAPSPRPSAGAGRPPALLDTRVIYCGDCLEQLKSLPDACVDLIYIDAPLTSNRNYEVFWGETKEKRFVARASCPRDVYSRRIDRRSMKHAAASGSLLHGRPYLHQERPHD